MTKPKNDYGIAWDYEETKKPYYHIYTFDNPADGIVEGMTITVPYTENNTKDVEIITSALRRILKRLLHSKFEHSK